MAQGQSLESKSGRKVSSIITQPSRESRPLSRGTEPLAPSSVRVVPPRLPVSCTPEFQETVLPLSENSTERFWAGRVPDFFLATQRELAGVNHEPAMLALLREFWDGEAAVDKDERGVVFELAIRRPFHANELRGEHGEACLAGNDDGGGVGDGIIRSGGNRDRSLGQRGGGQHQGRKSEERDDAFRLNTRHLNSESNAEYGV